MSLLFRSVLATILCTAFLSFFVAPKAAKAEIYYWQSPVSKISIIVPDDWRKVHNQKPDDILTFMAPSKTEGREDLALCRLRVNRDARYVIFPPRYSAQVRDVAMRNEFWSDYVGQYRSGALDAVSRDDGGLSLGFAGHAHMSFVSDMAPKMQRRGVALASIYRDTAYVWECSSEASAFNHWYTEFMGVLQSVTLRDEDTDRPGGYYRKLHDVTPLQIMNGFSYIDAVYY